MSEAKRFILELTFTEPLLGQRKTSKFDPHSVFYRNENGDPVLLDRHVMGFLKEAAQALDQVFEGLESTLTRKVFIKPKMAPLLLPPGKTVSVIKRPPHLIKAGGRKLATIEGTSEAAPPGTRLQCSLLVYPGVKEGTLRTLLNYGELKGLGLGRNQGFGRFKFKLREAKSNARTSA